MRVNIDGQEYVPKTDLFRLTDLHFEEAARFANSFEVIKWAHECQGSVAEMCAWARVMGGTETVATVPESKPVKKKPAPLVFGEKPKQAADKSLFQ